MPIDTEDYTIVNIEDEMKTSYLDYSMSVIIGRALPDVRDGLKPVHRRILYAMFREGLLSNRRFSKSAGVVGEVIKKYHPHGDQSVYDAMVRLVQDFNMRYPLIHGQGNFGSIDGDPAAAYRYTEAKLMQLAEELLADIDKDTVAFVPNFDEQVMQPTVLPTKVPNLLLNGSTGIAVGMATNIPPHNLSELIDGIIHLMENKNSTIDELIEHIKGPDFPTGGIIYGIGGIYSAYRTGRGIIKVRARADFEDIDGREAIIIREIPYQVNKSRLVEKIAELVKEKRLEGIADLRDESDRSGMRVVIILKRGENREVILNNLYKFTQMQTTFGVIMLTIDKNRPKVLNLAQLLQCFIDHRREVIARRTLFDLRKAEARAHILEGLKRALDNLDEVIALIRASDSPPSAKAGLISTFDLSEIQAQAILDMRLQKLTALEHGKLNAEYEELSLRIEHYRQILQSDDMINEIITTELNEIKEKYGDERRTAIEVGEIDFNLEDLISREEMVVTVSNTGYIKRNASSIYQSQRRGGKGKIGMQTKTDDFVVDLFIASTHDYLLFFTDTGRMFAKKVYEIPEASRISKGKSIVNLLDLQDDEKITAILPINAFEEGKSIIMATQQGTVKKTDLRAYSNIRVNGIRAIVLDEGDKMICAALSDGSSEVMIGTSNGMVVRFDENDLRSIGRVCRGVRGIDLKEGDKLIGMEVVSGDPDIICITARGFGKRTKLSAFRKIKRGGKGVRGIIVNERNGLLVSLYKVDDHDEIMLMSAAGKVLRMRVADTKTIGRNTQGVKFIHLGEGDYLTGVAKLTVEDEEATEGADGEAGDGAKPETTASLEARGTEEMTETEATSDVSPATEDEASEDDTSETQESSD